ncbi:hypothetical protein P7C73_g1768, partial [Tremellales sp. Uapishka_1]
MSGQYYSDYGVPATGEGNYSWGQPGGSNDQAEGSNAPVSSSPYNGPHKPTFLKIASARNPTSTGTGRRPLGYTLRELIDRNRLRELMDAARSEKGKLHIVALDHDGEAIAPNASTDTYQYYMDLANSAAPNFIQTVVGVPSASQPLTSDHYEPSHLDVHDSLHSMVQIEQGERRRLSAVGLVENATYTDVLARIESISRQNMNGGLRKYMMIMSEPPEGSTDRSRIALITMGQLDQSKLKEYGRQLETRQWWRDQQRPGETQYGQQLGTRQPWEDWQRRGETPYGQQLEGQRWEYQQSQGETQYGQQTNPYGIQQMNSQFGRMWTDRQEGQGAHRQEGQSEDWQEGQGGNWEEGQGEDWQGEE